MQSTGSCALHLGLLKEACIPSLKSIRLIVTELCSGQALGDADNADKSNPYTGLWMHTSDLWPCPDSIDQQILY
jgi:hypothetical protein